MDDVDCQEYLQHLGEEVKSWSYMKFPFLTALGKENGWYRVGPLARLNTAEVIRDLLLDSDITGDDLVVKGQRQPEGVGIIEAPRGTLIHHYRVNEDDLITMANLIVSTTHNNGPMNRAVDQVAKTYMTGQREITEPMMNAVEVAIRAYDPCLSCATHAYGQMPLEISLYDATGKLLSQRRK